jgi:hypothetical protein
MSVCSSPVHDGRMVHCQTLRHICDHASTRLASKGSALDRPIGGPPRAPASAHLRGERLLSTVPSPYDPIAWPKDASASPSPAFYRSRGPEELEEPPVARRQRKREEIMARRQVGSPSMTIGTNSMTNKEPGSATARSGACTSIVLTPSSSSYVAAKFKSSRAVNCALRNLASRPCWS